MPETLPADAQLLPLGEAVAGQPPENIGGLVWACQMLVAAYDRGEAAEKVEWSDVDLAQTCAREALALCGIPPLPVED